MKQRCAIREEDTKEGHISAVFYCFVKLFKSFLMFCKAIIKKAFTDVILKPKRCICHLIN